MWVMLKIQWRAVHRSSFPSTNSLERQNPLQAIARTVTVYHSEKIQVKVSQEKRHPGQISRKFPDLELPLSSPCGVMDRVTFPGSMCKDTHTVLPAREVPLSLGVQNFYWGSIT